MKVYLDDVRPAPPGWRRTTTVRETIRLIRSGRVREVSLDYDLDYTDPRHNGAEVLEWLAEAVGGSRPVPVPTLHVHTANPYGGFRMAELIRLIEAIR